MLAISNGCLPERTLVPLHFAQVLLMCNMFGKCPWSIGECQLNAFYLVSILQHNIDVDLTSGDTAFGGNDSIEDGMPDPFLGVGNEYSDGPRSR